MAGREQQVTQPGQLCFGRAACPAGGGSCRTRGHAQAPGGQAEREPTGDSQRSPGPHTRPFPGQTQLPTGNCSNGSEGGRSDLTQKFQGPEATRGVKGMAPNCWPEQLPRPRGRSPATAGHSLALPRADTPHGRSQPKRPCPAQAGPQEPLSHAQLLSPDCPWASRAAAPGWTSLPTGGPPLPCPSLPEPPSHV